jgi:hypothetical protein
MKGTTGQREALVRMSLPCKAQENISLQSKAQDGQELLMRQVDLAAVQHAPSQLLLKPLNRGEIP